MRELKKKNKMMVDKQQISRAIGMSGAKATCSVHGNPSG
jgi:hypothetical protein